MIDFDRYDRVRPLSWEGDHLRLLDQRVLPFRVEYLDFRDSDAVAVAIRDLVVRGAPAIGIAAAWGAVLAARQIGEAADGAQALARLAPALDRLNAARPTAVNLMWALARLRRVLAQAGADWREVLEREAGDIQDEDLAANRRMGELGAGLIAEGSGVLTHCNTGSLATAGFGTALGVIRAGVAMGRIGQVFAGETRPWLQGARLTVWELLQDGIPATLIADAAAKGGRIVTGGKRHELGGSFFEPTVIAGATPKMRFMKEEIFGPVAPVFKFETEEEAVELANDTEYGLACYFYTGDLGRAFRVMEGLKYGMVGVNEGLITTPEAPFGGVKESGLGREGAQDGIEEYLETKAFHFGGL